MSTPSHATRRPRPDDSAHLKLVYSADAIEPTQAHEDVSAPDAHTERSRTPLRYGSATVRALIALGTMAAALFHPELGKQLIGYQGPSTKPSGPRPEAADDDAPAEVNAPDTRLPRATPTPEPKKTAGNWTPGQRTVRVAYTIPGPAPTGRHRKATAEQNKPGTPAVGTGRHRRTTETHPRMTVPEQPKRTAPRKDRIRLNAPQTGRERPATPGKGERPRVLLHGLASLAMAG